MMEEIIIEWLDNCENCDNGEAVVTTDGDHEGLYDGDDAKCTECGACGTIHCEDGTSFVIWHDENEEE